MRTVLWSLNFDIKSVLNLTVVFTDCVDDSLGMSGLDLNAEKSMCTYFLDMHHSIVSVRHENMEVNHMSGRMASREVEPTAESAPEWHWIGMNCQISSILFHCKASRFLQICYPLIGSALPFLIYR